MIIDIMLDEGAKMPTLAHEPDAGYDLYARADGWVLAGSSWTFDTGVHIAIPAEHAGFIKSKSGLNVKHNLTADGVIDPGYTGSVRVKLYNHGRCNYLVHEGDKIAQLCIVPVLHPSFRKVDGLGDSERGDNGFGSSGR